MNKSSLHKILTKNMFANCLANEFSLACVRQEIALFSQQASWQNIVLYAYICLSESVWRDVGHATVLIVSGAVPVASGSR